MTQFHLNKEFTNLLEKYAELLTGDDSPLMQEKVMIWAVYQHISRSMPPLTKHWGEAHPDGRKQMRELFEEIKQLNEELRKGADHAES